MKTFISTRNHTILALLFLMGAMVNSATAQQYPGQYPGGAQPFYWRGADNTVYNLQIQIRNTQVELSSILYRARFIRYSPRGYQQHMAHVQRLQEKINYFQRQLGAYLRMHYYR